MKESSYRLWLVCGAMLGALAVACGAFGAHGLESHLKKDGSYGPDDVRLIEVWETAARYQMYHALALLAVGLVGVRRRSRAVFVAGAAMTLGTIIFSGCLYALVLSGQKWLGGIVPIGGALMIVGWIALTVAVSRLRAEQSQGNA
jgi:uncharacterized membrane protein YgdD (TMEM256/DUF423 family)